MAPGARTRWPCVAGNPGDVSVAAFARMRAFALCPNSGEFGYVPETVARHRWPAWLTAVPASRQNISIPVT